LASTDRVDCTQIIIHFYSSSNGRLSDKLGERLSLHFTFARRAIKESDWSLACQLHRCQLILNSTAQAVTQTPRFSHISPILKYLHWLKIDQRIQYKVLYKTRQWPKPSYLHNLLNLQVNTRRLIAHLLSSFFNVPQSTLVSNRLFTHHAPAITSHMSHVIHSDILVFEIILVGVLIQLDKNKFSSSSSKNGNYSSSSVNNVRSTSNFSSSSIPVLVLFMGPTCFTYFLIFVLRMSTNQVHYIYGLQISP